MLICPAPRLSKILGTKYGLTDLYPDISNDLAVSAIASRSTMPIPTETPEQRLSHISRPETSHDTLLSNQIEKQQAHGYLPYNVQSHTRYTHCGPVAISADYMVSLYQIYV